MWVCLHMHATIGCDTSNAFDAWGDCTLFALACIFYNRSLNTASAGAMPKPRDACDWLWNTKPFTVVQRQPSTWVRYKTLSDLNMILSLESRR
jgi:hypothetical protein